MEEKRGENGCTHRQVWVKSEEGTMQLMKRFVFGFLVFMISVDVAWSGERGYQLVAGRDSNLCARVLEAFREDMDDRCGRSMAAAIPARDLSADHLKAGRAEGARAKGEALFESL